MMADDYAGLMDALGIEKASVVGCSMGSIVAQELALRHPDKVKNVVLMCSWARCDASVKFVFGYLKTLKAKVTPAEFMEYIQLLIFHKRSWDDTETLQSMVQGRQEALENKKLPGGCQRRFMLHSRTALFISIPPPGMPSTGRIWKILTSGYWIS